MRSALAKRWRGRRPARRQPRCVHRARFAGEVREDRLDHYRIFDARDDAHGAAAARAGLDVDAEHALQALCPAHRGAALDVHPIEQQHVEVELLAVAVANKNVAEG